MAGCSGCSSGAQSRFWSPLPCASTPGWLVVSLSSLDDDAKSAQFGEPLRNTTSSTGGSAKTCHLFKTLSISASPGSWMCKFKEFHYDHGCATDHAWTSIDWAASEDIPGKWHCVHARLESGLSPTWYKEHGNSRWESAYHWVRAVQTEHVWSWPCFSVCSAVKRTAKTIMIDPKRRQQGDVHGTSRVLWGEKFLAPAPSQYNHPVHTHPLLHLYLHRWSSRLCLGSE